MTASDAIVEGVVGHITKGVLASAGMSEEDDAVVQYRATSYEIRNSTFTKDQTSLYFELAITMREFLKGEASGNTSKVLVIGSLVRRDELWEVEELDVGSLQSGLWLPSSFTPLH